MLKGHVQIELHNHKTGLRDRIEQDNLVTDAIANASSIYGSINGAANTLITPLSTNGLGGVLLFGNTLDESATNMIMPDNAKLIASANQSLNTENPYKGSINTIESGAISGGYLNVWDFTTSQANGIIKSLSLTNIVGGGNPFLPLRRENLAGMSTIERFFFVDHDNNYAYRWSNISGSYKVERGRFYTKNLPVDMPAGVAMEDTFTVIADSPLTGEKLIRVKDGTPYFTVGTTVGGLPAFNLYQVDTSDWTTDAVFVGVEGKGNDPTFAVCDDYCYFANTSSSTRDNVVLKKNINTGVESTISVIGSGEGYLTSLYTLGNNLVYGTFRLLNSLSGGSFLIYPDDTVIVNPEYTDITGVGAEFIGEDLQAAFIVHNYTTRWGIKGFPMNYLGTICNLESPVEKTAAMSMKVKYSLINV